MNESKNADQTPSTSKSNSLKELEEARANASDISCVMAFIDCGDLVDLDESHVSLDMEEMEGLFNLLDGVVLNLEEIQGAVEEHGTLKELSKAICDSIERAISIIFLAVKIERVRIAGSVDKNDKEFHQVSLVSVWTAGFLVAIRLARELIEVLYSSIGELCQAVQANSEDVDNAIDTLH